MGHYVIRRLLLVIPLLLGITIITYTVINLAPGDPITALLDPNEMNVMSKADLQRMREDLGLNKPLPVRYLLWLKEAARGNLGYSIQNRQPVTKLILQRLPASMALSVTSIVLALLLGVALGVFSLVPYLGVLVGSLPIVLLALGLEPSSPRFAALLVVFVGYQLFEAFAVQPRLDRRSIRIGPVLPLVVAMVAFELYGLVGALYGIAAAVFVVSVLDELAPTDADIVDLGELEKPLH